MTNAIQRARSKLPQVRLEVEENASGGPVRYQALSDEPWLRLAGAERFRSRWITLRYSTGLFEDPIRPLIRFRYPDGQRTFIMNGAVAGSASWTGRIPDHTESVSISPAGRPGPFGFVVNDIETIPLWSLLIRGLGREPALTLTGLGARLIGSSDEARHCFAFATGGVSFGEYQDWLAAYERDADLRGLDSVDWSGAPAMHLLLSLNGPADALLRTLGSLDAQVFRAWRVDAVTGGSDATLELYRARMAADARFTVATGDALSAPLSARYAARDIVTCLYPGDRIHPNGLGAIASAAIRAPEAMIFYGDEDVLDESGRASSPAFKPDFCPTFAKGRDFLDGGVFVRVAAVAGRSDCTVESVLAGAIKWGRDVLHVAEPRAVHHVRRVIHRRSAVPQWRHGDTSLPQSAWPAVDIVIPTRDRAGLLSACVEGLSHRTDYPELAVTLVDNGSTEKDALDLLDELAGTAGYHVIRRPGAFNYAALCNQGARAGTAAVIVFLNNDIEVQGADWLKQLVLRATGPDIGVVGAKLVFPGGRIQHAGVVLGMGEAATHIYRNEPEQPGYLGRLSVAHEVSAVTGAVMAVERRKFEAVGGFDEASFPVLYNDTDLCLRLAAKGWRTLLEPAACLMHRESASRGRPVDPFTRHSEERRIFMERWGHILRDDPCFHPALSLYSYRPALS